MSLFSRYYDIVTYAASFRHANVADLVSILLILKKVDFTN